MTVMTRAGIGAKRARDGATTTAISAASAALSIATAIATASERGWFERAGDEIASWFGDEEAERRRRHEQPDRFSGRPHLRNEEDVQRFYGNRDREPGRESGAASAPS